MINALRVVFAGFNLTEIKILDRSGSNQDRSYFLIKKMRLPQLRSSPIQTQQHYDKSVF